MSQTNSIQKMAFQDVMFEDPFFDSLKESYVEFAEWAKRKAGEGEEAYVLLDEASKVHAFLYVKEEHGVVADINPPLNTDRCLKIGTFKIDAHGTRLGERFVKKIFDEAIVRKIKHIYVTVFPQHEPLIDILKRYGFLEYGDKRTENGTEKVFLKDFNKIHNDILLDYPVVNVRGHRIWLLSIYPQWHTKLFPDSILTTEHTSIVEDLSHTNSVQKVYIAWMRGMESINSGDCLVIYRTKEEGKSGWYSSVATSLCVVEESRPRSSFSNVEEFIDYSRVHSVFKEDELRELYNRRRGSEMHVIRMTYNVALPKRPNRQRLVEEAGLDRDAYWGFMAVPPVSFTKIIEMGQVYEGTVIN